MGRIFSFLLLCSFFSCYASAAPVRITGCSPGYAGTTLTLFKYEEYITFREKKLAEIRADQKGCFALSFDVPQTTLVFLHLGKYFAYLYAEPGHQYEINLPERAEKSEADRLNPYFTEEEVHLVPRDADTPELNRLIARFDSIYGPWLQKYAIEAYVRPSSAETDTAVQTILLAIPPNNNRFFADYVLYKTGILRYVASQFKARGFSEMYFKNRPVLYENPAYMEFFHRIYDSYFSYFGRTDNGSGIYAIVNRQKSYTGLSRILGSDDVFQGDTLRDLVILKNLHDEFYNNRFSRNAILQVLDSFQVQSKVSFLRTVAGNILKKITRLMPGYPPPDFSLADDSGHIRALADFKGRYVYLNFCYCSSYSCLKEFEMLNTLYTKFRNYIEIVTILADPTPEKMHDFLQQNEYAWTFLHYGCQPEILKEYDIRAFPTYFLIGPDGKLILSPAPSPAENFQQHLFRVMRERGDL